MINKFSPLFCIFENKSADEMTYYQRQPRIYNEANIMYMAFL
jgi:hypothetical protein